MSLTKEQILDEFLMPILVGQLYVEEDEVVMTASLIDDLKADSIDIVELISALEDVAEKKFEVESFGISDEEAEKLETVGDVVNLLFDKQAVMA